MNKGCFVTILGKANVGKSTLINALVESSFSIVTPKRQTTRLTSTVLLKDDNYRIIFTDTPGIQNPKSELDKIMNKNSFGSIQKNSLILLMESIFDKEDDLENAKIYNQIRKRRNPNVYLLVNKIDLASKKDLMIFLLKKQQNDLFQKIIPISAKKRKNLDHLISEIKKDSFEIKDLEIPNVTENDNVLIRDIIRKNILLLLQDEIPHSAEVFLLKEFYDSKKNIFFITADIVVEKNSQKKIIVGHSGAMIKKIGVYSRRDLEAIFDSKIHLELFVRVEKNWKNNFTKLKEFGYL